MARTVGSTVFIYSLACPETGRVRYIGKANSLAERLRTHIRASRRARTPVQCWVKSLLDRNLAPVMALVATTDAANWEAAEREAIAAHRAKCDGLLNVAEGGAGPFQTKAQRARGGRTAAQARTATPQAAAEYQLRTEIGNGLKWQRRNDPAGFQRLMDEIRPLAAKYPAHFGMWADL